MFSQTCAMLTLVQGPPRPSADGKPAEIPGVEFDRFNTRITQTTCLPNRAAKPKNSSGHVVGNLAGKFRQLGYKHSEASTSTLKVDHTTTVERNTNQP